MSELKASHPSCHFFASHGIEYISELFDFFCRVLVSFAFAETVKFLVVVIFNLFAYSSQQAVFFAYLMLSTTFRVYWVQSFGNVLFFYFS